MKRGEARSKLTHLNGPQDPQQLGTATGAATDHLGVTGKWEGESLVVASPIPRLDEDRLNTNHGVKAALNGQ